MLLHDHTRRFTALVILLLVLTVFPRPAQADSAPPPPPSGSNLQPGQDQTQVRMMAETVTMQIAALSGNPHGQAKVTAHFEMRNLGSLEEKMEVRFPLNSVVPTGPNQFQCWDTGHPSIRDLAVRVDQQPIALRIEMEKVEDTHYTPNQTAPRYNEIPCWSHFWVTFPPGQDVMIDVTYTAQGGETKFAPYDHSQPFFYILETGAGWKDTIGKADIIVQAPFELNEQNLVSAFPKGSTQTNGNELRWHFVNLEPTPGDNIHFTIMEPDLWQAIQTARKQTEDNPNSGTAWANLAHMEHVAVLLGFPFDDETETIPMGGTLRMDPGGNALMDECILAYQKAIERQPKNIELRLQYAKLLWQGMFRYFDDKPTFQQNVIWSLEQVQAALEIDPRHQRAQAMLGYIAGANWGDGVMIDLNQPEPVYYILTPLPTATSTPAALPSPSATIVPTHTQAPPTRAAVQPTIGMSPTAAARADPRPGGWPWTAGLVVFGSVALLLAIRLRRRL